MFNLTVKLVAMAGIALLVHGTVVIATRLVRNHVENSAYTAVLEGIRHGDDKIVIDRARDYLKRVNTAANEPRALQIMHFLQEAISREVVRLVETGSEGDAVALLKSLE